MPFLWNTWKLSKSRNFLSAVVTKSQCGKLCYFRLFTVCFKKLRPGIKWGSIDFQCIFISKKWLRFHSMQLGRFNSDHKSLKQSCRKFNSLSADRKISIKTSSIHVFLNCSITKLFYRQKLKNEFGRICQIWLV